jgi:DNA-binding LytR/AlgR family response regulator
MGASLKFAQTFFRCGPHLLAILRLAFHASALDVQKMVEGKGFALAHRSYLVNMAHIWMFSEGDVTLTTNATVPVGRKYAAAMREAYKKYKGGAAP